MDHHALPILRDAYALTLWITRHCLRMQRGLRHTLGERLQTAAQGLCLALSETRHVKRVDRPLARADRHLDELRLLLRMACDLNALSERQLSFAADQVGGIGRQVGGWRRSLGQGGRP